MGGAAPPLAWRGRTPQRVHRLSEESCMAEDLAPEVVLRLLQRPELDRLTIREHPGEETREDA